jgi:cellulose synthase/poly-beta-1,6-N-acetylglucosamine synthase-like glycosyltransferase
VVFEPVPGTNRAREAGRSAATGDIIAFIDADNWPEPDWSETAIKYLNRPGVAAVAGIYKYRDVNPLVRFVTVDGVLLVAYPSYFFVHYVLRRGSVVQGGNFAARREALEKIGGLDVSYTFFGDDVKTGKELRKVGKVIFTHRLVTTASARRFKKHGWFSTTFHYFMNFVWVILFDKPFTR